MMKKNLKFFLSLLVGLSLLGLVITIFVNFRLRKGYETIANIKGITINRVRYSGIKDNRREWELEADSATQLKGVDTVIFKNVRLVCYAKDEVSYTLTGKEGSYRMDSGDVTATGEVSVVSTDGYTLLTDSLTYSTGLRRVNTKARVRITSPKMDVTGTGLAMDVETGRISILNDVRTVLKDVSI
ncbi:MAG: LPS export ABC transporter periplasmic protein LptC [Deltaproteobacteria bacterium]|nr:LPS export ABC transporter periplasmic protein LptC [Deltaproteobacteria bacterium]